MKKLLFCFSCVGIISGLYFCPQNVQAQSAQSKVTGTLIAPPNSSKQDKKVGDYPAGILPSTGERKQLSFIIIGSVLISIGEGIWVLKKRNEEEHV